MPTLIELTEDLQALEAAFDGAEDQESLEILLSAYLAADADRTQKLEGYAGLITELEARSLARETEAKRILALAKSDANRAVAMRSRLLWYWQEQGLGKVETTRFRINIVANGGKLPLIIDDEGALPTSFWHTITQRELDKDAIREVIAAGEDVPGAHLGERGHRISIK